MVIECAFGCLKARFGSLRREMDIKLDNLPQCTDSCFILHNFCEMRKEGFRSGSRTIETSKMERFVIIVNGFHLLIVITKRSILDVVAVLDLLLNFNTSELDKSLTLEKEFSRIFNLMYQIFVVVNGCVLIALSNDK